MIGTANDTARVILGLKDYLQRFMSCNICQRPGAMYDSAGLLSLGIYNLSVYIFVDVVRRGCDNIALCNIDHP